jgi:hypothetical protein
MSKLSIGEQFNALGKYFTVVEVLKKDLFKIRSSDGEVFLKSGRFYSKSK